MNDPEMKVLNEQLMNVRLDIRELSTKVDGMKDIQQVANEANDRSRDALGYAKAGQLQIKEIKDNQTWLWRTAVGALIIGAIGLLWKGVGG